MEIAKCQVKQWIDISEVSSKGFNLHESSIQQEWFKWKKHTQIKRHYFFTNKIYLQLKHCKEGK